MTSYSELVSDEYLLQQIGEAKSVSIFGCPYCANQSIALSKGMSVIGKTSFGGIKYTPYAVTQEANRIKDLLESNISAHGFNPLNQGARFNAASPFTNPGSDPPLRTIKSNKSSNSSFSGFL